MQRTQNKKNEVLLCTYGKCEAPQTEESGEFCDKHYPKEKSVFTSDEHGRLREALNFLYMDINENPYYTKDTGESKSKALKAITKLEKKLNTI